MAKTGIEWTRGADGSPGATWNPLRLVQISKQGPRWTGATAGPDRLDEPLRWRKPRKVFVCSMSDLFFEGHTDEQIAAIFGVMAACPQHTFQVLTKRAERMAKWFDWISKHPHGGRRQSGAEAWGVVGNLSAAEQQAGRPARALQDATQRLYSVWTNAGPWPLPNVWIGVSVEDQQRAQERLPHLLRVPAAVRWVSAEPLLGPVVLGLLGTMPSDISPRYAPVCERIHWVVTGGESGPGARPCDLAWIRALRDECRQAQVACFIKQLGARWAREATARARAEMITAALAADPKGGDINEFPADLRVREWPEVRRG